MEVIDNSKNKTLAVAYTTSKGKVFYSFANPLDLPPIRGLGAEKAKRFLDLKITERSMRELITRCKTVAGAGDLVEAFAIIQEIDYRLRFITEESSVLDLVSIYFILEDEDPEIPSEAKNREKHKIYEEDPKARAFFLRIGVAFLNQFSGKPDEDFLAYLEENKTMSERIRRFIVEESSITSMST